MRLWHCKCEKFSSRAKRDDRQNEAGESLSESDGARNPHRDRERSPAFFFVPVPLGAVPAGGATLAGLRSTLMQTHVLSLGAAPPSSRACGTPTPVVPIIATPEADCP